MKLTLLTLEELAQELKVSKALVYKMWRRWSLEKGRDGKPLITPSFVNGNPKGKKLFLQSDANRLINHWRA